MDLVLSILIGPVVSSQYFCCIDWLVVDQTLIAFIVFKFLRWYHIFLKLVSLKWISTLKKNIQHSIQHLAFR